MRHASGGEGPPVVFLHGWGVGPGSYRAPLAAVARLGCTVHAPSLPGFGSTPSLDDPDCSFAGYAAWVARYLGAAAVDGPVVVVGHSFGGGVAVQLAHDHPDLVRGLVLANAVGGVATVPLSPGGRQGERPLWDWGRVLGADVFTGPAAARVMAAVLDEAVPNLLRDPMALWRVAGFVRRADLRVELAALAARGLPLTAVWSDRDRLVPYGGFASVCAAARTSGVVVPGSHSWLIADPARFADVVLRALAASGHFDDRLAGARREAAPA